jgi:hypothetical protein
MRIKRALAIRDRGLAALVSCYSSAKCFGSDSATMNDRKLELLEQTGVNKAPFRIRSYLDGYWRALMDNAYQHDLVYGAIIGDIFYSTHRNRSDYYGSNGIEPSAFAQDNISKGHYWAESLKPFFIEPHTS